MKYFFQAISMFQVELLNTSFLLQTITPINFVSIKTCLGNVNLCSINEIQFSSERSCRVCAHRVICLNPSSFKILFIANISISKGHFILNIIIALLYYHHRFKL
jgi:hypothetical protein